MTHRFAARMTQWAIAVVSMAFSATQLMNQAIAAPPEAAKSSQQAAKSAAKPVAKKGAAKPVQRTNVRLQKGKYTKIRAHQAPVPEIFNPEVLDLQSTAAIVVNQADGS